MYKGGKPATPASKQASFERKDVAQDRKQGIKENSAKDVAQDKKGK